MIGRIQGQLLELNPPQLLLDVQGVGYEISAPMSTIFSLPAIGKTVTLHTHFVVREDAQLLYGFASQDERHFFREMLRISGIGAKMGLAVLSTLSTSELLNVIESGDEDALVRVPGIGKKTAQRVLLEMRGRLSRFEHLSVAGGIGASGGGQRPRTEAQDALQALGYSAAEARKLVAKVGDDIITAQDIIRLALQSAAK
ncbi:MAG: Holliday junction branch migration protein RuvA [Oceanococcus sp.]